MAELKFLRQGEEVMYCQLDAKTTRIGRAADNDMTLPENELYVSRHHVSIEERFGLFWLRDLTGQGVLLNGKPIREGQLKDQDEFALGRWQVVFCEHSRTSVGRTLVTKGGTTQPLATEQNLAQMGGGILRYKKGNSWRDIELGTAPFNIGKSDQNDLCLDLPYVSGFHSRIYFKDGRYFIRDLGSLNKTWVNGVQVVEGELPDGAEIYLGEFPLIFQLHREEEEEEDWPGFAGMISEDPTMKNVFRMIDRVAQHQSPVLITGESGTGKELVAKAIHMCSTRAKAPFVALNCGAISRDLIESALFGHEKGAFTGAIQSRMGAFEEAGEGTLFLDEIGDMPLEQQVSMLRVLEGGGFRRVGGSQELISQARVVAATHRDLMQRAQENSFREDLFYRIGVLQIVLPSLRQRPKDIPLLARYFLAKVSGPRAVKLSPEAMHMLERYSWPGNVRELKNVIQRAIVMAEGDIIQPQDLSFQTAAPSREMSFAPMTPSPETGATSLDEAERRAILNALEASNGVISEAAKMLGIGRSSIYSKMKRLGIEHRK